MPQITIINNITLGIKEILESSYLVVLSVGEGSESAGEVCVCVCLREEEREGPQNKSP